MTAPIVSLAQRDARCEMRDPRIDVEQARDQAEEAERPRSEREGRGRAAHSRGTTVDAEFRHSLDQSGWIVNLARGTLRRAGRRHWLLAFSFARLDCRRVLLYLRSPHRAPVPADMPVLFRGGSRTYFSQTLTSFRSSETWPSYESSRADQPRTLQPWTIATRDARDEFRSSVAAPELDHRLKLHSVPSKMIDLSSNLNLPPRQRLATFIGRLYPLIEKFESRDCYAERLMSYLLRYFQTIIAMPSTTNDASGYLAIIEGYQCRRTKRVTFIKGETRVSMTMCRIWQGLTLCKYAISTIVLNYRAMGTRDRRLDGHSIHAYSIRPSLRTELLSVSVDLCELRDKQDTAHLQTWGSSKSIDNIIIQHTAKTVRRLFKFI